jgi:hypothetical protein
VVLLFWNGQALKEEALKEEALKEEALKEEALKEEALKEEALIPAGNFQADQVEFTEATQIEVPALRLWLKKAGARVWDFRGYLQGRRA